MQNHGLAPVVTLAWEQGFRCVELEIDSLTVCNLIDSELNVNHQDVVLLREIKELLDRR